MVRKGIVLAVFLLFACSALAYAVDLKGLKKTIGEDGIGRAGVATEGVKAGAEAKDGRRGEASTFKPAHPLVEKLAGLLDPGTPGFRIDPEKARREIEAVLKALDLVSTKVRQAALADLSRLLEGLYDRTRNGFFLEQAVQIAARYCNDRKHAKENLAEIARRLVELAPKVVAAGDKRLMNNVYATLQFLEADDLFNKYDRAFNKAEMALLEALDLPLNGDPAAGIVRKVMVIVYDPPVPSEGGKRLHEVFGWNDPAELEKQCIRDLEEASGGYIRILVTRRASPEKLPAYKDGFRYDAESFAKTLRAGQEQCEGQWWDYKGWHCYDPKTGDDSIGTDYQALVGEHGVAALVKKGEVDDVWTFTPPMQGFYESIMGGPGAYFCNAPEMKGVDSGRRFVIMGFNYQRGAGEMLEDFGHRAESILRHVFGGQDYSKDVDEMNLWERFTLHEKVKPGRASAGTVHFAPNSGKDYEWGSTAVVLSNYQAWEKYPDLSAPPEKVDCSHWGGGDMRLHHIWWFKLMPRLKGLNPDGVYDNWLYYMIEP